MTMCSSPSAIRPDGQPSIVVPEPQPRLLLPAVFMHVVIPFIALPICAVWSIFSPKLRLFWSISRKLCTLIQSSNEQAQWYYQDKDLLTKLWTQKSAKVYINILEYQIGEGYCGSSTMRCILRSFGMDGKLLPPQTYAESDPTKWCPHIEEVAREYQRLHREKEKGAPFELRTRVVKGSVPYRDFLIQLKAGLADENVRIALNYLRAPLFGFEKSKWVPLNWFATLHYGHFSPVLGIVATEHDGSGAEGRGADDDDPLVAIFDTNAGYGGVYLVRARRLHESVAAVDFFGSKGSRAVVFVERSMKGNSA